MGSGALFNFLSNRSRMQAEQQRAERQQTQQALDNSFKMLDVLMKGGASDDVISNYIDKNVSPHMDGALDGFNYESGAGKVAKYIKTGYEKFRKGDIGLDSYRQYLEMGKGMFPGDKSMESMTQSTVNQQAGSLLGMMNQQSLPEGMREGMRQKIASIPGVPESMLSEANKMPFNVGGTDFVIPQTQAAQLAMTKETQDASTKADPWEKSYTDMLYRKFGTQTDSGFVINPEMADLHTRAVLMMPQLKAKGLSASEAAATAYDMLVGEPGRTVGMHENLARIEAGEQSGAMPSNMPVHGQALEEYTKRQQGTARPETTSGPSLGEFLLKARQTNPEYSERELIDYWNKKYGGK